MNLLLYDLQHLLQMFSHLPIHTWWKMPIMLLKWSVLAQPNAYIPPMCGATGNPHIQTSTYSGIAIITSQPNSVSPTPSPIGPKQCAAGLSCSNKKWTTLGRLSLNVNILNGLLTRCRKDLTSLPVRPLMGLITKAPQVPTLSPMKLKLRVILSYPTHKVFVKASWRSVVDMAFKPTSKVAAPSKTSWSPPRTKTLWSTKVVPYIRTNMVT